MTDALRARPVLARGVSLANKVITDAVYVAYPCLLVWLAYAAATGAAGAAGMLLRAALVPGISFVLVTVLRKVINAPRPYEVFDAAPVIPKDTRGNSFPSRHAFSIFVIAMTFCTCCPLAPCWRIPTALPGCCWRSSAWCRACISPAMSWWGLCWVCLQVLWASGFFSGGLIQLLISNIDIGLPIPSVSFQRGQIC